MVPRALFRSSENTLLAHSHCQSQIKIGHDKFGVIFSCQMLEMTMLTYKM